MKNQSHHQLTTHCTLVILALLTFPTFGQQTINEQFSFRPENLDPNQYFAGAVAIDDGIMVVGSTSLTLTPDQFAFVYDANTSDQLARLEPDNIETYGKYGRTVAIGSGIIAVGAPNNNRGTVFIYDASTYQQIARIEPEDSNLDDTVKFGSSIAIDDNRLVIGSSQNISTVASGAVYIYEVPSLDLVRKIVGPMRSDGDFFGTSVDIHNGVIIVGAWGVDAGASNTGAAYLFSADIGILLHNLTVDELNAWDRFSQVAIYGNIAAVGAWARDEGGFNMGVVYLFDVTTGKQLAKLQPDDLPLGAGFGISVDLGIDLNTDATLLVVGAWDGEAIGPGSAYIYDLSDAGQYDKLLPVESSSTARFGVSVAIDDGTVAVGAPGDQTSPGYGTGYLFAPPPPPCPQDLNDDGTLNFFDVSAFLSAFSDNTPQGDFNSDGRWNFFDISTYLIAYTSGCPT